MPPSLLSSIHDPQNLKCLSYKELYCLASEVRNRLVAVTKKNGGHLAPNLGVVELTIALHRVFDSPTDKLVFDVSHQTYVHKLLTGRNDEKFDQLRQTGGYSGFCNHSESEHDIFTTGHSGTALSSALGLCIGRDKQQLDYNVIAIIGDGALTCGQTMEAMNNISSNTRRLIVVLNDNEYSIDRNIGAIALYLNRIIKSKLYNNVTRKIKTIINKKKIGARVCSLCRRLKFALKDFLLSSSLFERYGLRYLGPIDGHNIEQLEQYLTLCKSANYPILLHVKTHKGHGNISAAEHPDKFHNIHPAIPDSQNRMNHVFGRKLLQLARADKRIIGITAAMANGTGLAYLRDNLPEQYIDVGIAEEHAVTMCSGLAKAGMRPVCAIYSTFMQRAFDQLFHDGCLQNLPIIFCIDRAGLSANDGPTHHGLFDITYIRCLPNAIFMQPRNSEELCTMLDFAMHYENPVFIRYNSAYRYDNDYPVKRIEHGRSEVLHVGRNICLIALGKFVDHAVQVNNLLGGDCGIVNARFIKPLDTELLCSLAADYRLIVTLEDNILHGGFGSAVLELYNSQGISTPVLRFGCPDAFIEHGSNPDILQKKYHLDAESIANRILEISENIGI